MWRRIARGVGGSPHKRHSGKSRLAGCSISYGTNVGKGSILPVPGRGREGPPSALPCRSPWLGRRSASHRVPTVACKTLQVGNPQPYSTDFRKSALGRAALLLVPAPTRITARLQTWSGAWRYADDRASASASPAG